MAVGTFLLGVILAAANVFSSQAFFWSSNQRCEKQGIGNSDFWGSFWTDGARGNNGDDFWICEGNRLMQI